ncbi:MAG: hypothetical protein AABZ60_19585 [Planctomycetota bacterium]
MQNSNNQPMNIGPSSYLKQETLRLKTLLFQEIQASPDSFKTDQQMIEFIRAQVKLPESKK